MICLVALLSETFTAPVSILSDIAIMSAATTVRLHMPRAITSAETYPQLLHTEPNTVQLRGLPYTWLCNTLAGSIPLMSACLIQLFPRTTGLLTLQHSACSGITQESHYPTSQMLAHQILTVVMFTGWSLWGTAHVCIARLGHLQLFVWCLGLKVQHLHSLPALFCTGSLCHHPGLLPQVSLQATPCSGERMH